MATVTVSPKYQIVIPKPIRSALGFAARRQASDRPVRGPDRIHPGSKNARDARLSERHQPHRAERESPGVNLVDSSGWFEYFADGPNADFFAPPIGFPKRGQSPFPCPDYFKPLLPGG